MKPYPPDGPGDMWSPETLLMAMIADSLRPGKHRVNISGWVLAAGP